MIEEENIPAQLLINPIDPLPQMVESLARPVVQQIQTLLRLPLALILLALLLKRPPAHLLDLRRGSTTHAGGEIVLRGCRALLLDGVQFGEDCVPR